MRIATQLVASTALAAIIATAPVAVRVATAAPEAQGADATAITEVVVTARKREERLKDVPIAVTAVTSDTLDRQQIIAVKDIAAFAPGLNINTDSVGRAFISIRGVGATLIDTVQPGVGIFIDGVYAPNTSYLNSPLLDVERIEVLRGPQGTLFGNNTLGGAISVITRQPSDTYHVSLSGAAAGDDNYRSASGSVSGPIIKGVLQAKLGIAVHDQDGFEKNTIAGGDANPLHQKSANAALRWQAAPNAVFTLNGYYDQVRGGTTAYIDLTGPRDYSENASLNVNSIATYTYAGANLKGVIDLPGMNSTLTAVGAIDKRDGLARGDGDFGPFDFIRVVRGANKLITYTGEVRVDTKFNDHLSSLVGVFANQSTTDTNIDNLIVPFAVHSPKVDHAEVEAQAVYGTLFWKFDTIELATGLRLDHQQVVDTADPKKYDTTELEPRVTLTKHWSPNNMTYASISRGFRGGGANGPVCLTPSIRATRCGPMRSAPRRALTITA